MASEETTSGDQILTPKVKVAPVQISDGSYRRYGKYLEAEFTYGTRQPETLSITITGEGYAYVKGKVDGRQHSFHDTWHWNSKYREIEGSLTLLYQAIKRFREEHTDYLNDIDITLLLY
jgi:hypothetical protein